MNLTMKLLIIYIFLIDSMIDLLINNNLLTSLMVLLTSIILPISLLLISRTNFVNIKNNKTGTYTNLYINYILSDFIFFLGIILYIAFSTYNLFIFFISFESIMIPMIYLISRGSSSILSKYRALYRFVLYTVAGGLILLIFLLISLIFIGNLHYINLIYYS